jgi:hypothetical protein
MLTARETITATVTSEAKDWRAISSVAQPVSGIVSVGLKVVALVREVSTSAERKSPVGDVEATVVLPDHLGPVPRTTVRTR